MTKLNVLESVCPQGNRPVVYFNDYTDLVEYVKIIPSASANIAYFEPCLQKWCMVEHETRVNY